MLDFSGPWGSCSIDRIETEKREKWLSHVRLCDPMDSSLPGSSIHGIFQARILEWVAISFSKGSSQPRIKPRSPALQANALPSEPPGKLSMPGYVALVLPSLSAHFSLAWHYVEHNPYSPSGQSERSTSQCQPQSMLPCLGNGNSLLLTPFRYYPVTCQLPPNLPMKPTPRGSQPQGTTYCVWPVLSSFQQSLRLPYLLGILPVTPVVLLILLVKPIVFVSHGAHCLLNPG